LSLFFPLKTDRTVQVTTNDTKVKYAAMTASMIGLVSHRTSKTHIKQI